MHEFCVVGISIPQRKLVSIELNTHIYIYNTSIHIYKYQFSDRRKEAKLECKCNFWHRDHVNPNRLKLADDFPSTSLHIKRTKQFNSTFADWIPIYPRGKRTS